MWFHQKCELEFQPNTATVGEPMAWIWGRGSLFGWPMANGWLYEKPVCKQSFVFTTHLNNTIWRLSVATISTPLVLAIAYYLLSSFFANLTPSQCPFHSLSLTLFLSLLFQLFLLHHLFCLPPVLPFILSLALFYFEHCMAINSQVTGGLFIPLCPVRRSIGLSVKRAE